MSLWDNRNWGVMLLKEVAKPFNDKDYLYEIKFDGIRAKVFVSPNSIQIISRNNHDLTNLYPELASLKALVKENTILDGEIVLMDDNGPSFSKLLARNRLKDKRRIEANAIDNPVIFIAFDILYQNKDLTNLPLLKRKKLLTKIEDNQVMVKSKYYTDGIKLFNFVKIRNLEGIVAKKIDSIYEIGKRSTNWVKIKYKKDSIFYIGGYELKKGNYISLLLGEYQKTKLYYVGKVTITNKNPLYEKLKKEKVTKKSPFINYNFANMSYISPNLTCTVTYLERTKDNHLRHPKYKENE